MTPVFIFAAMIVLAIVSPFFGTDTRTREITRER